MRLGRSAFLCLVVAVTALLIGGALLFHDFRGRFHPLPDGSVEEVSIRLFDKTYPIKGERAEQARRVFAPARRDDTHTKWISWGNAEMKLRSGETKNFSLFLVREGDLGIFEIDGQFYRCESDDQLNPLCDLASIEVDESLIPLEIWGKKRIR